jgi:hypothetical protein
LGFNNEKAHSLTAKAYSLQAQVFLIVTPNPFGLRKRVFLRCLEALAQIYGPVYASRRASSPPQHERIVDK